PVLVPHDVVRSQEPTVGLAARGGRVEPGYLPARGTALAGDGRLGRVRHRGGVARRRDRRCAEHDDVLRGAEGTHPPRLTAADGLVTECRRADPDGRRVPLAGPLAGRLPARNAT